MDQDKIFVTSSSLPPLNEYVGLISKIWESRWLTNNGSLHEELHRRLTSYLKTELLELFVNGHLALDIAIKALEIKGEVITTPFTFVSTTHTLTMNGIKPVFCDIKVDDYTIDEKKIEALITDRTSAILAVHVYGTPCNVLELEKIATKYNLKLIYDAAHAFGVTVHGKGIASYGDASMFSFHATKVFNSIEGGALAFSNSALKQRLRNLRNFGIEGPENIVEVGMNAKLNEFSAAMGIANLNHVEEYIRQREHVAQYYAHELSEIQGLTIMDFSGMKANGIFCNYSYYPVLVDETVTGFTRDELFNRLEANKIFARKYFYPLITECECYQGEYGHVNLPVAKYVSDRIVTLPMYPHLTDQNIHRICKVIKG